ncbi:hypothetical protein Ancab_036727 [Ancistrocladus abbreviatus]
MGNLLGIERMVESFWDDDPTAGQSLKHGGCQWEDHLRVKVRMTKRELKDLMAKLDITEDEDHHLKVDEGRNSELGRLIIKGGLEGRDGEDLEQKIKVEREDDQLAPAKEDAIGVVRSPVGRNLKGLARKVLPDMIGLLNSRLWNLWNPNVLVRSWKPLLLLIKNTGRSKGYGFVTFKDPEAAFRACQNPSPVIDGRRANCNLASLGAQKPRPPTPQHGPGKFRQAPGLVAQPAAYPGSSSTYFHQPSAQLAFPYSAYG